jgi:hypothetical protein
MIWHRFILAVHQTPNSRLQRRVTRQRVRAAAEPEL